MGLTTTGPLGAHLDGHLLRFERSWTSSYDGTAGTRLLLIVGGIELSRIVLLRLGAELPPLWIVLPLHLALAASLFRLVARTTFSQLGCRAWSDWNRTEKSYFFQQLLILNVVFLVVFAGPLRRAVAESTAVDLAWTVFVPYFFYGFYQEVAYRGVVQAELVRRAGALAGILVSNLLYTFGPLHSNYFGAAPSVAIPMFAGIFVIGLYLGLVFHRSGNLWIVAPFHGVANAYIVGGTTGTG